MMLYRFFIPDFPKQNLTEELPQQSSKRFGALGRVISRFYQQNFVCVPRVCTKFWIILFLFFWMQMISPLKVAAEESLEKQFSIMKAQFEALQNRVVQLEAKVKNQDEELSQYRSAEELNENRIKGLEGKLDQEVETLTGPSQDKKLAKWLPDIGVIADVVGTLNSARTDGDGADRVSLRELELIFGSDVDPFSRLDATVSFSDSEDPSLEEGYLTRFGLPFEAVARFGKFKPKVGKALSLHRDSLDTVDEPIVIQKYFGEEGLSKTGLDVTKTLNFPIPVVQQFTTGVLNGGGEEGTAFYNGKQRRPIFYNHLKNYVDVSDTTGFEWGFSHMIGSRDEDARFEVQILGSDITLTHQLDADQRLKVQGEVFNLRRRETIASDGNLMGAYGLLDMTLNSHWATGFRYDYVQPIDNDRSINPQKEDRGLTGYLTFHQSEFARWRLQATHQDTISGKDDNTVMIQGTFAIGEHKHKIQ